MSEQRLEWRVGLFVFISLVLLAALMLYFSKGVSLFKPQYTVYLTTSNVSGLRPQAKVLLSGVEVGTVESISLAPDGRTATVELRLLSQYTIHKDASFTIDTQGLLGDQFIAVSPTLNEAPPLKEGDVITAEKPAEISELLRASLGFISRIDQTAQNLNDAIRRVDNMVLNEQTLTNLAMAVGNFLQVSERAIATVEEIHTLFHTNTPGLNQTMSNLVQFSGQLNGLADELTVTIVTNRDGISQSVENLEKATFTLRELMADVEGGRGVVGGLLKDDAMKAEVSLLLDDLSKFASNISVLSSNINNKGLWRVLWKPKESKRSEPSPRTFDFPGRSAP